MWFGKDYNLVLQNQNQKYFHVVPWQKVSFQIQLEVYPVNSPSDKAMKVLSIQLSLCGASQRPKTTSSLELCVTLIDMVLLTHPKDGKSISKMSFSAS